MTVVIGALCDAVTAENTANIILCADKLITWTNAGFPISSNPNGAKIYDLPHGFFVGIADDISSSHVIVSDLTAQMSKIPPSDPCLLDRVKLALQGTIGYARRWMRDGILAQYGVTEDEWLHDKNLIARSAIEDEIANTRPSAELIVAGFSGKTPILFYTDCIHIQEQTSPGFFTTQTPQGHLRAGCGADGALHWLNLRQQHCFMSAQRTYYHVLEAKHFAGLSPLVGKESAILFLQPGQKPINLSPSIRPPCDLLMELTGAYWLRDTDHLDRPECRKRMLDEFKA